MVKKAISKMVIGLVTGYLLVALIVWVVLYGTGPTNPPVTERVTQITIATLWLPSALWVALRCTLLMIKTRKANG